VPQKPAEQWMVVMKANPKQGRATAKSNFSYRQSLYLLEYMIAANHTPFVECMISTFKHQKLLSSMHIFEYHMQHFLLGVALMTPVKSTCPLLGTCLLTT